MNAWKVVAISLASMVAGIVTGVAVSKKVRQEIDRICLKSEDDALPLTD